MPLVGENGVGEHVLIRTKKAKKQAAQPTWQDVVLCVGLVSCQNSL